MLALLPLTTPADGEPCNPDPGRNAFVKCRICHTAQAGAAHLEGPNLWGVIGRPVGAANGFSYSPALADADFSWTRESLEAYLQDPDAFLPGTRMMTAAIGDTAERRDLSCYIATLGAPPDR